MTIDVTDIVIDPDFASVFSIVRTAVPVDATGYAVPGEVTYPNLTGTVLAGSGQQLLLLDDGTRISDSITVYSPIQLYASANGLAADTVLWRGKKYVVKNVSNWENFGRGFCMAVCEFIGMNS